MLWSGACATDPGSSGPVLGQPLSRWLCGPGDAMAALLETLQSGRTVNGLIGTLRGDIATLNDEIGRQFLLD